MRLASKRRSPGVLPAAVMFRTGLGWSRSVGTAHRPRGRRIRMSMGSGRRVDGGDVNEGGMAALDPHRHGHRPTRRRSPTGSRDLHRPTQGPSWHEDRLPGSGWRLSQRRPHRRQSTSFSRAAGHQPGCNRPAGDGPDLPQRCPPRRRPVRGGHHPRHYDHPVFGRAASTRHARATATGAAGRSHWPAPDSSGRRLASGRRRWTRVGFWPCRLRR